MNVTRRLEALRSLGATAAMPKDKTDPTRPKEVEEDETTTSKKKDKEKDMTTFTKEEHEAALASARAEAKAEGVKEANARTEAVMASEHYVGREALAKTLLATDLSVDQISASLAAAPKIEASALLSKEELEAKAEEAGRNEMQSAIDGNQNSVIDVSGGAGGKSGGDAAATNAAWDKAVARVFPGK